MAKDRLRTRAQREQLAFLRSAGAFSSLTGKAAFEVPGLNAQTLGILRRHKEADSRVHHGGGRQYTVYWLTPSGKMAADELAQPVPKHPKRTSHALPPVTADMIEDQPPPKKKRATKNTAGAALVEREGDLLRGSRAALQGGAIARRIRVDAKHKINVPGFWRMPSDAYHADPCPSMSISSGIAHTLIEQSPKHAFAAHPRGGAKPRAPSYAMDIGSAVHALAFGDQTDVVIIEAKDRKSEKVRGWIADIRGRGKIPILQTDKSRIVKMAEILIPVLEDRLECKLKDATGEIVIAAKNESIHGKGGWRRTRVDLMNGNARRIVDVKTTDLFAAPAQVESRLFDNGAHIQQQLTFDILDELDPDGAGRRSFDFVCIEQNEPFGVSVIAIEKPTMEMARQQTDYACATWDECVAKNEWPGYAPGVHRAAMPGWRAMRWQLRAYELGLIDSKGEPL